MRQFHIRTPLLVTLLLCAGVCIGQNPVILAPLPQLQFFDQSGRPLSFGCVFTYATNTTTPLTTYTDYTGNTPNSNPVVLSAGGSANIWIQAGITYAFRIKSSGGTNCSSGSTLYTVNGIGGGISIVTTAIPYSPNPSFPVTGQNQLFTLTLTGDATSQPITAAGILSPGFIVFQITQDGAGGHNFTWPANVIGGAPIGKVAGQVTTQMFVWNGTNATAIGPAITGTGPALSGGSLSLSASQYVNGFQGTAGTKLTTAVGSFSNGVSLCANSTQDIIQCPGATIVPNASSTGTTLNTLTKLTGNPSTAVIASTADTAGIIGITTSGAGTSGSALIQQQGIASCVFDAGTTAGDLVGISSGTAGDCHDTGAASPTPSNSGQIVGQVLSTNSPAGTYSVLLTPVFNRPVIKYFHGTGINLGVAGHQTTATWSGGAFVDTNYSFSCILWSGTTAVPGPFHRDFVLGSDSKLAASANIWMITLDSVTDTVNLDCTAIHD